MQVNDEINKVEAAKAFWKTREFDPVTVAYVDGDQETKFQEELKAKAKVHGKDQVKKLPITVQK